jgi:hypothetical protein
MPGDPAEHLAELAATVIANYVACQVESLQPGCRP